MLLYRSLTAAWQDCFSKSFSKIVFSGALNSRSSASGREQQGWPCSLRTDEPGAVGTPREPSGDPTDGGWAERGGCCRGAHRWSGDRRARRGNGPGLRLAWEPPTLRQAQLRRSSGRTKWTPRPLRGQGWRPRLRPSPQLRSICELSTLTQSCEVKTASNKAFTDPRAVQPPWVLSDILEWFISMRLTKYSHIILPDFLAFCLRCRVYFGILREQTVSNQQG